MHQQVENKRAALLSILLHIVVVCIGMLTTVISRPHQNLVFMDVDVIGEGELNHVIDSHNTQPIDIPNPTLAQTPEEQNVQEPIPPVTEHTQSDITNKNSDVEQLPVSEEDQLQHIKDLISEENKPLQIIEESPSTQQEEHENEQHDENKVVEQEPIDTQTNDTPIVDKQVEPQELPPPIVEEPEPILSPPKKEKPVAKKTSKKSRIKKKERARKRLLSVLKKVEKEQAKQKTRKKIKQLASDALKQQRQNDAFDKMLNESAATLSRAQGGTGLKGRGVGNSGMGLGVSDDDCRMISAQITPHWIVPSGVKDVENIVVEVEIQLLPNGIVIPAAIRIIDQQRYKADAAFRAAADSTKRAILSASPLRIPKEKIHLFQKFIFRFNLKEALGG